MLVEEHGSFLRELNSKCINVNLIFVNINVNNLGQKLARSVANAAMVANVLYQYVCL